MPNPDGPQDWTSTDDSDINDMESWADEALAASPSSTIETKLNLIKARIAIMRQRHGTGP